MTHARPHLETHTRSAGHTAVGGAAYRLGLRLYDDRNTKWHDYKKRKDGGEVVAAFTLAPEGAAPWARDASQLWNAVERAEKRKDAQLARDYRAPIPFQLSDDDAIALSTEMSRFIIEALNVPVSVGLHRDGRLDAFGVEKSADKVGMHAHLYFPTRVLLPDGSGFGAKLSVLSNKHTSGAFVESLNARWADLANFYCAKSGLVADYDHKSYARAGLDLTPQVTLGAIAVALGRQGIPSRRGDYLRVAMATEGAFQQASMTALYRRREDAAGGRPAGASSNGASLVEIAKFTARPRSGGVFARRTVLDQNLSLAQCLRRSGPRPSSLADKEALERAMLLADFLESCLATFESNRVEEARFRERLAQSKAAALTIDYEVDVLRRHRSGAQKRLKNWEKQNRWQIRFTGMLGSGFNADRKEMEQAIADANRKVQAKKAEGATQRAIANESEAKAEEHKQRHLDAERRAKKTAEQGESALPGFLGFLRAGLKQGHRQMLAVRGGSNQAATAKVEGGSAGANSGVLALAPTIAQPATLPKIRP